MEGLLSINLLPTLSKSLEVTASTGSQFEGQNYSLSDHKHISNAAIQLYIDGIPQVVTQCQNILAVTPLITDS